MTQEIIYKGITIFVINPSTYTFWYNGTEFHNTNLRFAKVMINRQLKK